MTLRSEVQNHANRLKELSERLDNTAVQLARESAERESEVRALRQSVGSISREFEAAIARVTDNQDVIRGVQAFVRLVSGSVPSGGG